MPLVVIKSQVFQVDSIAVAARWGICFTVNLGGATKDIAATHNANYNLFTNIGGNYYWSDTNYAVNNGASAWTFIFHGGSQAAAGKTNSYAALAVRSGQVAAVPVPAAAWLFGSGLLGLMGVSRRRLALR